MNPRRPSLDVSTWEGVAHVATADASSWPVVGEENRGLREKRWVRSSDGALWLRKRHRPSRPFEPAIEVFALELARACGIDSAHAVLATWTNDDGKPARGVCVVSFLEAGDELVGGARVLRRADATYDPEDRTQHTLERVLAALLDNEAESDCHLVEPFARILLFDAWIGNGDRHPGNWSLVRRAGGLRLSPMYDPAGCLGAELQPDHALLAAAPHVDDGRRARLLTRYVDGCRSGFGDGAQLISMEKLVQDATRAGILHKPLLATFEERLTAVVPELLQSFDETSLPSMRRRFILDILRRRLTWLKTV